MALDDPKHREMMDLEGLKQWLPDRTSGFGPVSAAVAAEGFLREHRAKNVSRLPLFPVTTIGSWPRPPAVLDAQR